MTILGAKAQSFYGLQNSNFNGVHGMYMNPALLADNRYRTHSNITCFGFQFANDFMNLELPYSLTDLVKGNVPAEYKNADGALRWDPSFIQFQLNGKDKNMNLGLEMRGPAFMKSVTKRFALGGGTRVRTTLNLNRVSEDMALFAKSFIDSQPTSFTSVSNNRFAMNFNSYQEVSGSAALVLLNKRAFYLKAGATAKYLMGIGSAYIRNNGVSLYKGRGDSLVFINSDVEFGQTSTQFLKRFNNGVIPAVLPSLRSIVGSGFGFDFGAVFEYRPEMTEALSSGNSYLFRGGVSMLDWGKINFGKNMKTYSASNSTPVLFTADSLFARAFASGIDSGLSFIKNYAKQNFNYSEGTNSEGISIPTTLNFQFDWNVIKMFYVGVNWSQSVVSRSDIAIRRPSSIVLIPRIETRLFEVSVPMSLYNDYRNAAVGLFARVGPVFVGSDNLLKSVNRSTSFSGFNFYFGISTGIPTGKAKKGS